MADAPLDWQRVADRVRRRRLELGIEQETSPVSGSSWTKLENAKQDSYKPHLLARVEAELGWPIGTIMQIARGEDDPAEDADLGPRIADLEGRLSRMEETLARVEEIVRRLPGGEP